MKIDKAAIISAITLLAGIGGLVSSAVFTKPLDDLFGSALADKVVDVVSLVSMLAAYIAAHYSSALLGNAPQVPAPPEKANPQ